VCKWGLEPVPSVVLFVNDEPLLMRAVTRELRGAFTCHCALGRSEAIPLLESEPVDYVVADFLLADGNGVDLLREVAQRWPRCRRLLVSAHLDQSEFQAAQAAGLVHALLRKPWGPGELLQTLQQLDARRPRSDAS
jgi:DNA-binding NarL/FixJ family response regulator